MTHRSVSLFILGALVFATAPLASAQSFDGDTSFGSQRFQNQNGRRAFGQARRGISNFRENVTDEARTALQACRQHETQEERRSCFSSVKETHDLPNIGRRGRQTRKALSDIPQEARDALKACRDSDDRKACAKGVKEQYNIELPHKKGGNGKRHEFLQNLSDEAKEALKACRDSDDRKACVMAAAGQHGFELPEHKGKGRFANVPEDARDDLKACRDSDDRKVCAQQVADDHGFELPGHTQNDRRRALRRVRRTARNLPDEGKTALWECRNSDSREAFVSCVQDVQGQYSEE